MKGSEAVPMGVAGTEVDPQKLHAVPLALGALEKQIAVLSESLKRLNEQTASAQASLLPIKRERPEPNSPEKEPVQPCPLAVAILGASGAIAGVNARLTATIDRLEL